MTRAALWTFWLAAALLCLALYLNERRLQAPRLPLPAPLHSLEIIRADTTLRFTAAPSWQYQDKNAAKLAAWLEQLRRGCPQSYPEAQITLPADHAPITLRFNGSDDWTFTAHNPYNRSHYLHHQGRVYLCAEQLKARLTLPPTYWLD